MSTRLEQQDASEATAAAPDGAHEVTNRPPPLCGYNAWRGDAVLMAATARVGAGWIAPDADGLGDLVGSERMQLLADQANRYPPVLITRGTTASRASRAR